MQTVSLTPEWERIDLLGSCLAASRRGEPVPVGIENRLRERQAEVRLLREQSPWAEVIRRHRLSYLDQEILTSVLAPEAEPRLGWMFYELQPGLSSPYPCPALIRELYFLEGREAGLFHERLAPGAPLFQHGLLVQNGFGLYQPLKPTPRANAELLGWIPAIDAPPGTMQVETCAAWEDLVLPSDCLQTLKEFLFWITHREKVARDWGAKLSGGPVALFAGPSGTGKTFSAEVLANFIGWPLYRVDLGFLVSKYVGETEKNLNALFDAAYGRNLFLLFDEADSLFGKRAKIREAHDRFANMEVSHLLTRIERHQGPCILTSNMRWHLDSAFARRFQTVIEFPRPDAEARNRLWQIHLPPRAPMAPEIADIDLGAELNLTGGQIRNVALHASFLAAGEDRSIDLYHIARAVWLELSKEGQEVRSASLGRLSEYLHGRETNASD